MRVVVDGRPFVKRATGVATCLRDTIRAICIYLPDWELILALPKPIHRSITDLPLDKIEVVVMPVINGLSVPNFIWYHIKFPFIACKMKADLIWGTNTELPIISVGNSKRLITICDVVWKEFKETMTASAQFINIPFLDNSVMNADFIYNISKYTQERIEHYFPKRKCTEMIAGISCSTLYQKRSISNEKRKSILEEFCLSEKFVLFVGSLEPRKNLLYLMKLMPEIYNKTGAKLLVVGGKGWKSNNIHTLFDENPAIKQSVVFANYVSFDMLVDLYNIATVYVSTSLNEGFGLPQLEAMKCGCPVISPHNSAMIEVVEGRGITIEGWDEQIWINKIVEVLTNDDYRESLCHPDLSDFDWKNIVLRLDNYIKRV